MENYYQKSLVITPSLSDASGHLSIPSVFSLFMDIASEHAETLNIGFREMSERRLFWLTVKTQICVFHRPRLMDTVSVGTWLDKPGRMRSVRCYEISSGGQSLITGKTEWALINRDTLALTPLSGVYPESLDYSRPSLCPEPFARIPDAFDGAQPYADYRVRSTDIDIGGHMNNAAYIRALIGSLPNADLQSAPIRKMDVIFRASCYEGDLLSLQKRTSDGATDFRLAKDNATILLARMI